VIGKHALLSGATDAMKRDTQESTSDDVLRTRLVHGDLDGVVEELLEQHGPALFGFIVSIVRDPDMAQEAFQAFSIRLWRGLPGFRWQGSIEAWMYCIARHASYRALKDPFHRRAEHLETRDQQQLPARWSRTVTERWRRTEEKQRLWSLIQTFEREDQELLLLRLGRNISWLEIARILAFEADADPEDDDLKRAAATLRQRFARLKKRLRAKLRDNTDA